LTFLDVLIFIVGQNFVELLLTVDWWKILKKDTNQRQNIQISFETCNGLNVEEQK
jgi:hypothetical protein